MTIIASSKHNGTPTNQLISKDGAMFKRVVGEINKKTKQVVPLEKPRWEKQNQAVSEEENNQLEKEFVASDDFKTL